MSPSKWDEIGPIYLAKVREEQMRTGAATEAKRRAAIVREVERILTAQVAGKTDEAQRRLNKALSASAVLPWTVEGLLLEVATGMVMRLCAAEAKVPVVVVREAIAEATTRLMGTS